MIDRALIKWNGWGWSGERYELHEGGKGFFAWLGARLGADVSRPSRPPVPLEQVALPVPRGEASLTAALAAIVGEGGVQSSRRERVFHAVGRSLHDLLRLRAGSLDCAPEAVVYPREAVEVASLVRLAAERGLALVPFGGGSSVVGGVEARDPRGRPVVTVDLTRMDRRLSLDPESRLARFEAGIYGPALERSLEADGLTLGHYPQSFEFSTLGGWIAARSAGQQSNRYGRIEQLLMSCRLVTPAGELATWRGPASAAGPDLNAFVTGSEGTFGILVDATMRVTAKPERHDVRAVLFPDFASGAEAVRAMCQEGLRLSYLRLSDAEETELYLQLGGARRLERLGLGALSAAGYGRERCVMLVGTDGRAENVAREVREAVAIARRHRGLHLGRSPARGWLRDRFAHPYLRDTLLDHGVAIDTLETATTWENVGRLRAEVCQALADATVAGAGAGIVTSHLSHSYDTGSSLYFIFLYPCDSARAVEQWWGIKRAASDALVRAGGTISHHHGIGLDHRPWLAAEKRELGLASLRALKASFDPQGIMNPGKLLGD